MVQWVNENTAENKHSFKSIITGGNEAGADYIITHYWMIWLKINNNNFMTLLCNMGCIRAYSSYYPFILQIKINYIQYMTHWEGAQSESANLQ